MIGTYALLGLIFGITIVVAVLIFAGTILGAVTIIRAARQEREQRLGARLARARVVTFAGGRR